MLLNYDVIDYIAEHGNMAQHEQLDTFLMQWFNSSDGLKSLLLDVIAAIYQEVRSCRM
jgi:hypothetical protein